MVFGAADAFREALVVEAADFVGVKSFKAKGKRLTQLAVDRIEELEPLRQPEADAELPADTGEGQEENRTEDENGQMNLFTDEA